MGVQGLTEPVSEEERLAQRNRNNFNYRHDCGLAPSGSLLSYTRPLLSPTATLCY